jgi:hypothetical protein
MQVKCSWGHATESKQAIFGIPPETFNAVDVVTAFSKFVLTMINPKMLTVHNGVSSRLVAPLVKD